MPDSRNDQGRSIKAAFGSRVREARGALGFTQERAAEAAGISWPYWSGVENGHRNVSLLNILAIASALNVTPGSLVDGLDDP